MLVVISAALPCTVPAIPISHIPCFSCGAISKPGGLTGPSTKQTLSLQANNNLSKGRPPRPGKHCKASRVHHSGQPRILEASVTLFWRRERACKGIALTYDIVVAANLPGRGGRGAERAMSTRRALADLETGRVGRSETHQEDDARELHCGGMKSPKKKTL